MLAPRGAVATGIIIDDCLTSCKERATLSASGRRVPIRNQPVVADCQQRIRQLHAGYARHGLNRHEQKAVWRKYSVVAWGASVDGKAGP